MSIKKTCYCGKDFQTYQSKIKIGRGKYCSRKCSDKKTLIKPGQRLSPETEIKKGSKPWNIKGWRYTKSRAGGSRYKLIHLPNHPNSTKAGYIREHRLVMEKHIGRLLDRSEIVHHIDGNTLNNNIKNLELMNKKDHDRMNVNLNIHKRWLERR